MGIDTDEEPCSFLCFGSPILLYVMSREAMYLSLSIPSYSARPAKRSYLEVMITDMDGIKFCQGYNVPCTFFFFSFLCLFLWSCSWYFDMLTD